MSLFSAFKTLNSYYFLSSHYSFLYSILHHSAQQHFKFILGSSSPLLFFFLIPAVLGQVPKLLIAEIQLSLFSFKFFSQSVKRLFLFEHAAQDRVVLFQRHDSTSPEENMDLMLILASYDYVCWDARSSPSQVPTILLTTISMIGLNYHLKERIPTLDSLLEVTITPLYVPLTIECSTRFILRTPFNCKIRSRKQCLGLVLYLYHQSLTN